MNHQRKGQTRKKKKKKDESRKGECNHTNSILTKTKEKSYETIESCKEKSKECL